MIKLPAYLINFRTKVDKTAGISIGTNEITDQEFLELKRLQGSFGWFIFRENEEQDIELPTEDAEEFDKSPSERLRGIMFALHKQRVKLGKENRPFKVYYNENYERLCDLYKLKFDEN